MPASQHSANERIPLDRVVCIEQDGCAIVGSFAVVHGTVHVAWRSFTDSAAAGDVPPELVAERLLARVVARALTWSDHRHPG